MVSITDFGIAPLTALRPRAEDDHEKGLLKGAGKGGKNGRRNGGGEVSFDEWTERMLGPSGKGGRGKGKTRGGRGKEAADLTEQPETQGFSSSGWAEAAGLNVDATGAAGAPAAPDGIAASGNK